MRASRSADGTVRYTTNFEALGLSDAQICFYLLKDGKRIGLRSYGPKGSGVFSDAPENVSVKAFVRNAQGIFLRQETPAR